MSKTAPLLLTAPDPGGSLAVDGNDVEFVLAQALNQPDKAGAEQIQVERIDDVESVS